MQNRLIKIIVLVGLIAVLGWGVFKASNANSPIGEKAVKSSLKVQANKPITEEEKKAYFLKTNFIEENGETPFNVYSDGAIVVDSDTGEILYQKNPDMKLPTASISKVMTAVIALENSDLNKEIEVSKNAAEQIPNSMDLVAGEKLKLEELLYGLMMLSANDSSFAIAEGTLGLENFVSAMNEKAKWLELKNTNFTNPAGLDDPNHKSSAYDLGVITRYALNSNPKILNFMGALEKNIQETDRHKAHYVYHVSGLLKSYEGMDGAKTGYTWDAGHTFIGTAKRDGKRLIVVVLNSHDAGGDITSLLDYGFRSVSK